jgi:hypothetical protein
MAVISIWKENYAIVDIQEDNLAGLYIGPFPWENTFSLHLAGMNGHDFFKPSAVIFDFETMQIFLQ